MSATGEEQTDVLEHRYVLLERLGSGGMAVVHRAWDRELEVFCAIKILTGVAHKPRIRARLETEARTMQQLAHPNVVPVHDLGSDLDRLYLVMEYVPGGTLMERVERDGPLPPRMAANVLQGVLSALALAHDHGVIHRDIKPHNILLDADGVAKLADFGIARIDVSAFTRTGAILGTLAYMPPEQKLSARKVDARSDLYATGATLFALLTGREPFDLYAAGMDASIADDLFEGVPEALRTVIRKATAFKMEDRFEDALSMSAALTAALGTLEEDPDVPPLVSAERLAQARADASMGPTLVSTGSTSETVLEHSSAPMLTIDTLSSVAPPSRTPRALPTTPVASERREEPTQRRSPLVWLALAFAGVAGSFVVVLVMGVGMFAWWSGDRGATTEIAAPTPDHPIAPIAPADATAAPTRIVEAEGASRTPTPVPDTLPEPEPEPVEVASATPANPPPAPPTQTIAVPPPQPAVVAPPPPAAHRGGWTVDVLTEAADSAPRVVGSLTAQADVVDASGRAGRPKLLAGCQKSKRWLTLDAGVESVNLVASEAAGLDVTSTAVTITTDSGSHKARLNVSKQVMANILFRGSDIDDVLASRTVAITYYPFGATEPVVARFTNDGVASLQSEMASRCKL